MSRKQPGEAPKQERAVRPRRDPEIDESEVIASRQYAIDGFDPVQFVTAKIGKPALRDADGRYECAAEIRESGRIWVRRLVGDDALEALQVALALVSAEVNHLSQQPNIRLSWLEGRRRDLGLPSPPKYSLLPDEKEATKDAKSKARASNGGKKRSSH